MPEPYLIVVAGCNGAGKSRFSKSFVKDIVPFDYDARFNANYQSLQPIDIRHEMANNLTTKEFKSSINGAFSHGQNFCYETNFDSYPIEWMTKAKKIGYQTVLVFFCLKSREFAKKRVARRVDELGHPVADQVILDKWKLGYKNLNLHYDKFDYVLLVDNSSDKGPPRQLFALEKQSNGEFDVAVYDPKIPDYAERRYPDIYNLVKNSSWKVKLRRWF